MAQADRMAPTIARTRTAVGLMRARAGDVNTKLAGSEGARRPGMELGGVVTSTGGRACGCGPDGTLACGVPPWTACDANGGPGLPECCAPASVAPGVNVLDDVLDGVLENAGAAVGPLAAVAAADPVFT